MNSITISSPVSYMSLLVGPRRTSFLQLRRHYCRWRCATGLYGCDALAVMHLARSWGGEGRVCDRRITVRHRQLCDALRIKRGDGISQLVAEIGDDEQLYLGPDMVATPETEAMFLAALRKIVSVPRFQATGETGRSELFTAMHLSDVKPSPAMLSSWWQEADPKYWRQNDLWVFAVSDLGLPGTTLLRAYPYPDAQSDTAKVELLWIMRAGGWMPRCEVDGLMLRKWTGLGILLRPRFIDLRRLAARTGRWRGLGITQRVGEWQRRALCLVTTEQSAADFKRRAEFVFDEPVPKPTRLLESLVDRGMLNRSQRGSQILFAPVDRP